MKRKNISFEGLSRLPFEEWEDEELSPAPPTRRSPYDRARIFSEDADKENSLESENILYYFSMGSGSSGNSCYLGNAEGGIIIDAGVKADEIESMLKANGISMPHVKGVLLTHDHADHMKHVYTLLRRNKHLRVFCTNRVLDGLLRRQGISKRIRDYHVPIFKEIPFSVSHMEITAFEVYHDGSDNMGFSVRYGDRRFVLATDMGAVSARARHYITDANYLVIESNYDLPMLLGGTYPEYLKARIQTQFGHMDNAVTASFLSEIINDPLDYIFLCHLSKDNNTPEKALTAVRKSLEAKGLKVGNGANTIEDRAANVQLVALPRYGATRLFAFRPPLGAHDSK